MSQHSRTTPYGPLRKYLLYPLCAIGLLCLVLIGFVSLYIPTPQAAARLSRLLSDKLHQPVLVSSLSLQGGTLRLKGLTLTNPPDFPGLLASADAITVQPRWSTLLGGRRELTRLSLEGLRVQLARNRAGQWNFAQLQQRLAGGKPAAGELLIGRLLISNGEVRVEGRGVQGINLQLFNLSSRGSHGSQLRLAFQDARRSRYTVSGTARGGGAPQLDLTLEAPGVSLAGLSTLLGGQTPSHLEGEGSLHATLALREGRLESATRFSFSNARVDSPAVRRPFSGSFACTLDYNLHSQQLRLPSLTLELDRLARLRASGWLRRQGQERSFQLAVASDEMEIAQLAPFLPQLARQGLVSAGRLSVEDLQLAGNGRGKILAAQGLIRLKEGSLSRRGTLLVSGLEARLQLNRQADRLGVTGRLDARSRPGALVEQLDAPFQATLSSALKPLEGEVPRFSARVMGIPGKGSITYRAAAARPLSYQLILSSAPLTAAAPLVERFRIQPTGGRVDLELRGTAAGREDLGGTARMAVQALQGRRGGQPLGLESGHLEGDFAVKDGRLNLSGRVACRGAAYAGQSGDGSFSFQLAQQQLTLGEISLRGGGLTLMARQLTARVPQRTDGAGGRFPLGARLSDAEVTRGGLALKKASLLLSAELLSVADERWLEGRAELEAGQVAWQGQLLGAPQLRLTLARSGVQGELGGRLLEGTLSGQFSFQPLVPVAGGSFRLAVSQARLGGASSLLPPAWGFTRLEGTADLSGSGSFSREKGLEAGFVVKGTGLGLEGRGGKSLLSQAAFGVAGTVKGQTLAVEQASLSAGKAALTLQGRLEQAFSPKRKGHFTYSLPRISCNDLVDPLANFLPRLLQEASLQGSLAAEGRLELAEGRRLLNGTLQLQGVGLEATAQRLKVQDMSGTVPVSLDLSGQGVERSYDTISFTREHHPLLLRQLSQAPREGQTLQIARMEFGPLQVGPLTARFSAGYGLTRLVWLRSDFYGGEILGKGLVTMEHGLTYRGDLLINGLSLKEFCAAFPGIAGYISGIVEGVISIEGSGKGMAGIAGFSELWAREGKREKMLISKDFLQRLSGKKLSGFFFRNDRSYDRAEITALLEKGYLTLDTLDIKHTNLFGVTDLNIAMVPTQNRIALDHLLTTVREATVRGKVAPGATGGGEEAPAATPEFKWEE